MIPSVAIKNDPFQHCVIDNFIGDDTVRQINREWPENPWDNHYHDYAKKRGCYDWKSFGRQTAGIIRELNAPGTTDVLGRIFGFDGLVADDSLLAGGLHETFPGGFLNIHADFNIHPASKLIRRLNLLLFLNLDWKPEWGGQLELWACDKSECRMRIEPIAGRCVIFETSDSSFHGHPFPLQCPEGLSRRSIALYYYSPARPGEKADEHSTLYLGDEANWPEALIAR